METVLSKKRQVFLSQKEKVFRLGELFCGPGGLALGAVKAKCEKEKSLYSIKHTWATDYDQDSCLTYLRNICPDSPETVICKNIHKLSIETLQPIDAFAFGFPCNDFSIVGEKRGFSGTFGPLYTFGIKILDYFKPVFFVAENVGGITSANDGSAFQKILFDLENGGNGYCLTTHLYKFEKYGIPQARQRIVIVGIDKSLGLTFKVPSPITSKNPVTVRNALESPPILKNAPNHDFTKQSKNVVERLKFIRPGENAWNANIPDSLKLNVKAARLSHIYRRLHPDKPSYTITGSGGGGTHVYHWSENRALTNRERARLQTFPDDFIFEGSKESVRKQIGMAVPPKMSEIIFTAVLKTFAGIEYKSVSPSWDRQPTLF